MWIQSWQKYRHGSSCLNICFKCLKTTLKLIEKSNSGSSIVNLWTFLLIKKIFLVFAQTLQTRFETVKSAFWLKRPQKTFCWLFVLSNLQLVHVLLPSLTFRSVIVISCLHLVTVHICYLIPWLKGITGSNLGLPLNQTILIYQRYFFTDHYRYAFQNINIFGRKLRLRIQSR